MAKRTKKSNKISTEACDAEILRLQTELVKMQEWVRTTGARVVVIFEGRDAAGKGGTIKRITEYLSPRVAPIAALPSPTERERGQWYYQRYIALLPARGEITLFDRSWYNRAGVERVMGFCTQEEYDRFLFQTPIFEKMLVDDGILLFKYWLCCDQAVQEDRFLNRELSWLDFNARVLDLAEAQAVPLLERFKQELRLARRITQRERMQRHLRRIDVEHGEVVRGVHTRHAGGHLGAAAAEADRYAPGAAHDVGVGEDVALPVDDEARAGGHPLGASEGRACRDPRGLDEGDARGVGRVDRARIEAVSRPRRQDRRPGGALLHHPCGLSVDDTGGERDRPQHEGREPTHRTGEGIGPPATPPPGRSGSGRHDDASWGFHRHSHHLRAIHFMAEPKACRVR